MNSKTKYFVLYQRKFYTQSLNEKPKGKELYDQCKSFDSLDKALDFYTKKLTESPVLAKKPPFDKADYEKAKNMQTPYIVAGYFGNKYHHSSHDDGINYRDPVPTHEAVRCSENGLEKVLDSFHKEHTSKIYIGIELQMKDLLSGYSVLDKLMKKYSHLIEK